MIDDIALHARFRPTSPALSDLANQRHWSYSALDELLSRCAGLLSSKNISSGSRVAALSRNRAELVILHLACARIGAIFVPLNWRLSQAELENLITVADPALIYAEPTLDFQPAGAEDINSLLPAVESSAPLQCPRPDPDTVSLILFTSGTSGTPKGVQLSERNLAETAINSSVICEVNNKSVYLVDSPMFHIIGLVTCIRPALMRGGSILVSDAFIPERTLERLSSEELGVTHYFCVPQMAQMLREEASFDPKKLKNLTALFTGGAPHPEASIRAWLADGIPIVDGYGMSEGGTIFGMPVNPELIDRHAGSAGLATRRVRTKIVDHNEREVAPGESGELLLKSDSVFKGYWNLPQETQDAFTADGWFRTGDIVRVNDEGFHWIVDRRKDMFISGGENVYPAEIEAVLAGMDGIREAAVVGVADEKWGEVGHLFWVTDAGAGVTEEMIRELLNSRLARYKIPKHFSQIDALPRNGAGKILKTRLRESAGS